MKKHYKCLGFLFFFLALAFILPVIPFALGNSDIKYTFNNEILLDYSSNVDYTDVYNSRYPEIYTNYYNGTYDFNNETIDTQPNNWVIDDTAGNVEISESVIKHDNILNITDTDNTDKIRVNQNYDDKGFGTLEGWLATNSSTDTSYFYLFDNDDDSMCFYKIDASEVRFYYVGNAYITPIPSLANNEWFHFRIDFDFIGSGYQNITKAYDAVKVYTNGIYNGEFETLVQDTASSEISFQTYNGDKNYEFYVDAIGYSWDSNYNISDNIIPYSYENESFYDKDKVLFENDQFNRQLDNFDPIPWNDDVYTDYEDCKYMFHSYTENNNKIARLYANDTTPPQLYVSKNFSLPVVNNKFLTFNISFKMINLNTNEDIRIFLSFHDLSGFITLNLNGVNSTHFEFRTYYHPSFTHITYLEINKTININLILNEIPMAVCKIYQESNLISQNVIIDDPTYSINSIDDFRSLSIITQYLSSITPNEMYIYNIGMYYDNISLSYTNIYSKIDLNILDDNIYNLFNIDLDNSNFNGSLVFGKQIIDNTISLIYEEYNFFQNRYEKNIACAYPNIYFFLNDSIYLESFYIYIDSIFIRGISVSDSFNNKNWVNYNFLNVNNNYSYFYVDSYHRLNYNLTTNDNNTEYIRAIFNIENALTTDRFLTFSANINGGSTGSLQVAYSASSDIIILDQLNRGYSEHLTQEQTLDYFVFQLTDDDNLYSGYTHGSISSLILRYSTNLDVTLLTLSLLTFIVPLLVILFPSIALAEYSRRGLFVPLFFLFSLVLAISYIIPYWILFVISVGFFLFILTEKEYFEEVAK